MCISYQNDYFRLEYTHISKTWDSRVKFNVFFVNTEWFHSISVDLAEYRSPISSVMITGIWVALVAQYCKWLHYYCKINTQSICYKEKQTKKKLSLCVLAFSVLRFKNTCPSTSIHCFSMERNRNFPWCLHIGLNKTCLWLYNHVLHCAC